MPNASASALALGRRTSRQRVLHPLELRRRDRVGDPVEALRALRLLGQVRFHPDVRVLPDDRHVLAVDVLVAHAVREPVHARLQQILAVLQREDVRDDARVALVGFVDDRAVDVRLQLRHGAEAVVHPDLDDGHFARDQFLDFFPSFGLALGAVRHAQAIRRRRACHRRRGNPAADGQEQRGVGDDLVPQLVRQLRVHVPPVEAHAHRRRDAVIRVALQVVDDRRAREVLLARRARLLVRVSQVIVGIDDRGHHGLAGQVHARRARRQRAPRPFDPRAQSGCSARGPRRFRSRGRRRRSDARHRTGRPPPAGACPAYTHTDPATSSSATTPRTPRIHPPPMR